MNIEFHFRHIDTSEHLKEYSRSRFEKLGKYLTNADNAELQVTLGVEKFRHRAEVVLVCDNMHLSANEESDDMYSSIDLVLDKLEGQVKRLRERSKDRRKTDGRRTVRTEVISLGPVTDTGRERTIVESDEYEPKPMDVEEAAWQLESLNREFVVFHNAESNRLSVLYRLRNGNFGLIDPGL